MFAYFFNRSRFSGSLVSPMNTFYMMHFLPSVGGVFFSKCEIFCETCFPETSWPTTSLRPSQYLNFMRGYSISSGSKMIDLELRCALPSKLEAVSDQIFWSHLQVVSNVESCLERIQLPLVEIEVELAEIPPGLCNFEFREHFTNFSPF